jgi:hypothetical protein
MIPSFAATRGGFLMSPQDGVGIEAATKLMLMQHH